MQKGAEATSIVCDGPKATKLTASYECEGKKGPLRERAKEHYDGAVKPVSTKA
ncbi:hypothetical protein [Ferrimonas aestuarii]|uniref:hypothetical protein n=1 Tax=Ferrimonas aestuarii TaxID=2569539 RepID=UPI00145FCC15|nr:hypothetical protein [Ferrimonas aestuarii]